MEQTTKRRAASPRGGEHEAAWKGTPQERIEYVSARRATAREDGKAARKALKEARAELQEARKAEEDAKNGDVEGAKAAVQAAVARQRDARAAAAAARADRRRRRKAKAMEAPEALEIDEDAGYRKLDPGVLDGVDEVVTAARERVESIGHDKLPWTKKANLAKYMLKDADLALDSPYMRLALSEPVIATVSDYLGIVPVLNYVDIWYSRHSPDEPERSQLWHLDNADVTQVKLFVHAGDVDADSGPLTILPAGISKQVARRIGYSFEAGRVDDEIMGAVVSETHEVQLTGPEGTAFFVDTSRCFHYGSRVEKPDRGRLVAVFQYLTPFAFVFAGDFRDDAPFRELATEDMPAEQQFVLGAR